jgi:oxygen-independent coproporphyrinogen-3 oxidase
MFGFGNQTLEEAMEDLNKLFDLGVKHISWYQFSLEPNSVFYSHSKNVLASDNLVSNIIESGLKVLKSNGMTRYEVSAYVDENFHNHKAKHNLNYWNFGDYIGVGAGAHGKITDKNNRITRTNKTRHPDNYLLKREISHIRNTDIIGSKEIVFEYMLNNLRVNGKIVKKDFTIKTGHSWNALLQTLDKYLKKNIIVLNQDCLVVGDKTWGMMDDILQEFL